LCSRRVFENMASDRALEVRGLSGSLPRTIFDHDYSWYDRGDVDTLLENIR
jgi:hypothetical protein